MVQYDVKRNNNMKLSRFIMSIKAVQSNINLTLDTYNSNNKKFKQVIIIEFVNKYFDQNYWWKKFYDLHMAPTMSNSVVEFSTA